MILLWIGGGLRRPHQVNIQSVKLELYANTLDWLRLVMELGFVTYVGFQLGTEMNELISVASQGRPGDYLNDPWNILVQLPLQHYDIQLHHNLCLSNIQLATQDCLNIALFTLSILWRVQYVYLVSGTPLEVPTDEYKTILEDAANLQSIQVSESTREFKLRL
eukprot:2126786-Rhodomonas_salina.2